MALRSIIVLHIDKIATIEQRRYSMIDMILLACKHGRAMELRKESELYGRILEGQHHTTNTLYMFHKGELIELKSEILTKDPTLKAAFEAMLVSQGLIDG